jgi:hypothetical protein
VAYTLHVTASGPGGTSPDTTAVPAGLPTGTAMAPDTVPTPSVAAGSVSSVRGGRATITGSGFKAATTVQLTWFPGGLPLGTATVSATGTITATVTVPTDTSIGAHTLLATGLTAAGAVRYLTETVTIATPTAPSGAVTSVAARRTAQNVRDTTVTWSSTGVVWGNGVTRRYAVTVTGPAGAHVTGTCTAPVADSTSPACGFTSDVNGSYRITVTPQTDAGSSATAPASTTIVVSIAPGSVTNVHGTAGANSMAVAWTAPAATSVGAGITGYTVTASAANYPTQACAGSVTTSPCTITGLAAGVAYTLRVVANGPGGSSAEVAATPATLPTGTPSAPTAVPATAVPAGTAAAAQGAQVTIAGSGFKPASTVLLTWYTTPIPLGTVTASATGTINATVTVPSDAAAGTHTLLATGLTPTGGARYLAETVAVSTASSAGTVGSGPITGTGTGPITGPVTGTNPATGGITGTSTTQGTSSGTSSTNSGNGHATTGGLAVTGTDLPYLLELGLSVLAAGLLMSGLASRRLQHRLSRHRRQSGRSGNR